MAYTTIDDPTAYFQTTLYTGNGSTNAITNSGNSDLQPDWVWLKNRSTTQDHELYDSVRGATKALHSNATDDESTYANGLTAFGTDGFTVGDRGNINGSGNNIVSWNWKASGTSISNSSGSNGATLASAGIKNDTAGISIVTYTGDGNARTVFHGLSSCDMVFHKCLNNTENWGVQHKDIGAAYQIQIDTTIAKVDKSGNGSMALPAANVFSVNNSGQWGAARNYVAYAFRSVKGYSKFGSYTGNGNADGTFVYTGFKPAFVLCKNTGNGGAQWLMVDNKRVGINPIKNYLQTNSASVEGTDTANFDFLSNGFKCRSTNSWSNQSGYNIIYMAFAENPFVTSSGVPACAR